MGEEKRFKTGLGLSRRGAKKKKKKKKNDIEERPWGNATIYYINFHE
jgi:hypothetical protein